MPTSPTRHLTGDMVIYGRVIYRDTITPNQEHETQWCFGYIPDAGSPILGGDFISTGPEEYTGHQ